MEPRREISKDIFFRNQLAEHEHPPVYSLEAEFAQTKKNWDITPYLVFFGFIILLLFATVKITDYLDQKSKQVQIDISDFEDLRLKETLTVAKENEYELEKKSEELDLKAKELKRKNQELVNKTKEIKQLNSSFEKKIKQVKEEVQEESDLQNADKKALKRLEEKQSKHIDALKKEYEQQIAKKQAEIDRIQDKAIKVDYYQYGLNAFLKEQKAAGCVIDPRQPKNILLYLQKSPKSNREVEVELYRGQKEYIGKLKLISDQSGIRAESLEVSNNQSIKPLDWFRLP